MQLRNLALFVALVVLAGAFGKALKPKHTVKSKVAHKQQLPIADNSPCSNNQSATWVDVILMIDTSMNMAASNLRQLATTLPQVFSNFNWQYSDANFAAAIRVAVVTYGHEATIAANFTDVKSASALGTVLSGITNTNSNDANLYDAFFKAFTAKCPDAFSCSEASVMRPTAYLIFGASVNTPRINTEIPNIVAQLGLMEQIVTVNYNSADPQLTALFNSITTNLFVPVSLFNFTSSSTTLSNDLAWSVTQADCFCGEGQGISMVGMDTTNNRYQKYARCIVLGLFDPTQQEIPDSSIDMCTYYSSALSPAAIMNQQETDFINAVYQGYEEGYYLGPPYYIGLHQNSQGNWVWYDYDMTEFPLGTNYNAWAPGYPATGNGTCVEFDYDQSGNNLVWKNVDCDPQYPDIDSTICQAVSCDAMNSACDVSYYYDDNVEWRQIKDTKTRPAKKNNHVLKMFKKRSVPKVGKVVKARKTLRGF